mgnify:CR=1 FL=1
MYLLITARTKISMLLKITSIASKDSVEFKLLFFQYLNKIIVMQSGLTNIHEYIKTENSTRTPKYTNKKLSVFTSLKVNYTVHFHTHDCFNNCT